MKVLIGVDHRGLYRHALRLLQRLGFGEIGVTLVHAVESMMPDGGFPMGGGQVVGQLFQQLKDQGEVTLSAAKEAADLAGFSSNALLEYGDPSQVLVEMATQASMDLIAIGSEQKRLAEAIFFGSVGKGVVLGSQCPSLVARHSNVQEGPLTAVFATDHSPFASRCADRLIELAPRGIGKLVVFSSLDHEPLAISSLLVESPRVDLELSESLGERIAEMNAELAERLRPHFGEVLSEVRTGHPNETIRECMEAQGAELVIMGAQGHSWFERVTIGSRSLHQVMHEPYSVLVIRPR